MQNDRLTTMRSYLLAIAITLAAASWHDECQRHCTHKEFNHVVSDALDQSCETYRYVLPRPKVYRKCKAAFDRAIQQACSVVCDKDQLYGARHTNDDAHHMCKAQKEEVPKPVSHEACIAGYLGGAAAAQRYGNDIRAKHVDGMADSAADEADAAAEAARAAAAAEAEAAAAKAEAEAAAAKAKAAAEAAAAQKAADEAAKAEAEAAKAKAAAEAAEAQKAAEEKQQAEMEAAREAARAAYSKAQEEEAAATEANAAEPVVAEDSNLRGSEEEVESE